MPSTVISAATSDGDINSTSAVYATARSGGGTVVAGSAAGTMNVGQRLSGGNYRVSEGFVSFDTSGLTNIDSAVLSFYAHTDFSTTDFILEARLFPWATGGLTSADFLPGDSMSGQTLLATVASSMLTFGVNNDMVSEPGFASAINTSGVTDIVLVSDRVKDNTTPSGDEYILVGTANAANEAKLTIEYDSKKITVVASPMRW